MRHALSLFLALFSAVVFMPITAWANESLWDRAKRDPNIVIFMRHAFAAGGHPLTWDESGNCKGEAVLSAKGRDYAKKVADAFATRGIAPTVITSPMCRCKETAEIAFGKRFVTDPDLREIASADQKRLASFEGKAISLIAAHRGASPIVFVNHLPNINVLTLELISETVLLFTQADKTGEVEVLGKIDLAN